MRLTLITVLILAGVGCASGSSTTNNTCVAGASAQCTCSNGKTGAQVCGCDGTFGVCSCMGSTGTGGGTGSGGVTGGGTGGRGGANGSGGANGTGGTVITGGGGSIGGTANTYTNVTVIYNNTLTRQLSHCYGCVAAIATDGTALVTYQLEDGYTTVAIDVQPGDAGAYKFSLSIDEFSPTVATMYQGGYKPPGATYQPVTAPCITFNTINIRSGGTMDGNLNCMLQGGPSSANPIPATITGTFHATFP